MSDELLKRPVLVRVRQARPPVITYGVHRARVAFIKPVSLQCYFDWRAVRKTTVLVFSRSLFMTFIQKYKEVRCCHQIVKTYHYTSRRVFPYCEPEILSLYFISNVP